MACSPIYPEDTLYPSDTLYLCAGEGVCELFPATDLYPDTDLYSSVCTELPPAVTTGSATGVDDTTATVSGIIDPNDLQTHYYFEYSFAPRYDDGLNPPTFYGERSPETNIGAGTPADPGFLFYPQSILYPGTFYPYSGPSVAIPVSANLTGLATGRTYYYTLVAWNGAGISYGDQESFDTGVSVLTEFELEFIHQADRGQ